MHLLISPLGSNLRIRYQNWALCYLINNITHFLLAQVASKWQAQYFSSSSQYLNQDRGFAPPRSFGGSEAPIKMEGAYHHRQQDLP
jgi:hypothetical protein